MPPDSCFSSPDYARRRFMASAVALPILLSLPGRVFAASQIHQLQGRVYINNRPARLDTPIMPGSQIEVGQEAKLAFSLGGDAFLLRSGTTLEITPGNGAVAGGLRLVTGALLSVFDKRKQPVSLVTNVATIGIRGTAVYLDLKPRKLYTCTCYGHTDLQIAGDSHVELVSAIHHNAHEVSADGSGLMRMQSMEVIGHTDDELRILEGYVGRIPEFDKQLP